MDVPEVLERYTNGSVVVTVYRFDEKSLGVSLAVKGTVVTDTCAFNFAAKDIAETHVVLSALASKDAPTQ